MSKKNQTNPMRTKLMEALTSLNINHVVVDFDGSGDSGQIECVSYYNSPIVGDDPENSVEVPAGNTRVGTCDVTTGYTFKDGAFVPIIDKKDCSLNDLVEEVCYEALPSGWEINEGSYGQFVIVVPTNEIKLVYNERIESVETSERLV